MCYFVHSISSPENMKPMFHEAENDLKKGVAKTMMLLTCSVKMDLC